MSREPVVRFSASRAVVWHGARLLARSPDAGGGLTGKRSGHALLGE